MTGLSERVLLVVAAPGRSGTSLLTGLVGRLGYHIPQPELRPNETNPRGFGEPKWAVEFHKRLLAAAGVNYGDTRPDAMDRSRAATDGDAVRTELAEWLTEQFGNGNRVIVKDPRLLWFVDLYRAAAADLDARFGVLTTLRHPAEVVRSAGKAYGTLEPATVAAGWINALLAVEGSTRTTPRALVRYDELMRDWRQALQAAEGSLGIELTGGASAEELAHADELVDASLHRSRAEWTDLPVPAWLQASAAEAFDALAGLAGDPGDEQMARATADVDRFRAAWHADYRAAAAVVRSTITEARLAERRRTLKEAAKAAKAARQTTPPPPPPPPPVLHRVRRRLAREVRRWRKRS